MWLGVGQVRLFTGSRAVCLVSTNLTDMSYMHFSPLLLLKLFSFITGILGVMLVFHGILLSGWTLHGVCLENQSWWKALGFNLCVAPPHDRVVSNFRVTEFTEFTKIFRSRLEIRAEGCTMVDIRTDPIIHDCVHICIYGNECIYETER